MSDAGSWGLAGDTSVVGALDQVVTLVEETSFCLSTRSGEIKPGSSHGLFFLDTRFVSRLTLRIDDEPVEMLGVTTEMPFAATFAGRMPGPGGTDGGVVVFRRRRIGRGMVERMTIWNYTPSSRVFHVALALESDFADLFAVKRGRVGSPPVLPAAVTQAGAVTLVCPVTGAHDPRRLVIAHCSEPPVIEDGVLVWRPPVDSHESWEVCIDIIANLDGEDVVPRHRCDESIELSSSVQRLTKWQATIPVVDTDRPELERALHRSAEDLGALRLVDPSFPDDVIVAAGAPWFMTVFGRDSLITGYMALLFDPRVALGVLRTLARLQGREVHPGREEEPGRILHEIRFHDSPSWKLSEGTAYYGSIDSTPLFVMLLGELRRWGLGHEVVETLMPNVDRAIDWIEHYGDRDGDGYVEYERATENGLKNQGWKDSGDAIRFADGRLADDPIALCEVQGYVYMAFLARAYFADEQADPDKAGHYRAKAAALKEAFNRDFWLEDRGYVALALDGDKRPVDALASNMGHCLWTGILDEDKAACVAQHLMGPDLFSGWGVRTLARSMAAYDPLSYHNGSVWPHDNALIAAGLVRYGFVHAAHRIIEAMIEASSHLGGRLPELFSGMSRDELAIPAPYPTSCIPQAWAAASPLLFLRCLLRFDPWMPHDKVWIAPELPPSITRLSVSDIRLGQDRASIFVDRGEVDVHGLPANVEVIAAPRSPLSAALHPPQPPPR